MGMTLPRPVLPGCVYLLTRRCTQREFLMRPDAATNEAFTYCLAMAAEKTRVQVLFTCALSNHHHTGIWDVHGNYPEFLECFHKLFAKCQNSIRGRWENFWSSEQASVVRLVDPEDILAKMVYALANPVLSHLVERCEQWPGVNSLRSTVEGRSLCANRPKRFFRENGKMPPQAQLTFVRPPGFERLTHAEFTQRLLTGIRSAESKAATERSKTGHPVIGPRGILQQDWRSRPRTQEPLASAIRGVALPPNSGRVGELVKRKGP